MADDEFLFPSQIRSRAAAQSTEPSSDFVFPSQVRSGAVAQQDQPSLPSRAASKFFEPITNYPSTYAQMNQEAREQIARGIAQNAAENDFWTRASGAGNIAAGAMNYVTSPVSAALRTGLGKPTEELTGIPKEYPEFAGSLLLPIPKRVPVPTAAGPLTKTQEIAKAAERLEIPLPRAAVSPSETTKAIAGGLKEIPVIGAPLVKQSKEAAKAMAGAEKEIVSGYGTGDPTLAGESAKTALEKWITGTSADVASRLYDRVTPLVNSEHYRPLSATRDTVADIMARRENARIQGTSGAVQAVRGGISTPMNYEGIKDLRTYFSKLTPDEMIAKGIDKQEAKQIYTALTQDLRDTVAESGGPKALDAFDRANTLYQRISDKRDALAKIVGKTANATPEQVLDRISAMAGSKRGADYQGLIQARRAIGAENWDEVSSAIINRMGRDKPGAEFSGDRFKTAWDAIPAKSRQLLFNSTNKPELASDLQDLMTVADAHKQLLKYGNPSGTGRVAALLKAGGTLAALWSAPISTIGGAVGGYGLSRFLASPIAVKQASKTITVLQNALQNPTPARLALVTSETNNLARTLENELGQKLLPPPQAEEPQSRRVPTAQLGFRQGGVVGKVNRSYDVPFLSGPSKDGKVVYIDRRLPARLKIKRAGGKGYVMIDPALPLSVHEHTEQREMERLIKAGMSDSEAYRKAHDDAATSAERRWVEQHGLSWSHYEEVMDGYIKTTEHENPKRPPPNLYVKPYSAAQRMRLNAPSRADGGKVDAEDVQRQFEEDRQEEMKREAEISPSFQKNIATVKAIGNIAPRGIPWEKMRKSTNVEDQRRAAGGSVKMSKTDAQYMDKSDKPKQRCIICSMFRAPSTCTAVQGPVKPAGWCKLFERK